MLEIRNISKKYGDQLVVNNVSFNFEPGKIYGIIGPNGAGKSTLLRLISAFEKPSSGEVLLQNKKLLEPTTKIACMWQKPYLFQTTVFKNIAYGLKVRGIEKKEIKKRMEKILKQFRLEDLRDKPAKFLSGGEGARVALARAIACDSPIIVLDEPAANLDPPNTRMMEEILLKVQKEKKLTVIIVTHDMFQARRLAHYTLFMENGILKEANFTSELFTKPLEKSTQRFLQGLL
ncbi:MAG: tungstate transport system ATP-binding protein [Clostridia bacterium]|nr:tungstate transport system ATP-binding protein [Clostridia bacterium]MDN5323546.1 tungstate transport system ATP-binding protein [Clostridia bacterium]